MSSSKELKKLQKNLAKKAELIAKIFNFELDYSHKSIQDVESVLSFIHDEYKKKKMIDGLDGIALEFAAYIITVIEKQHLIKGEWRRDHQDFGKDSFPYYWNDIVIFPFEWCKKRIINGLEDSVSVKYKALILNRSVIE